MPLIIHGEIIACQSVMLYANNFLRLCGNRFLVPIYYGDSSNLCYTIPHIGTIIFFFDEISNCILLNVQVACASILYSLRYTITGEPSPFYVCNIGPHAYIVCGQQKLVEIEQIQVDVYILWQLDPGHGQSRGLVVSAQYRPTSSAISAKRHLLP